LAADAPSPPKVLRFGVYEADLRRGELRKFGLRLKLQEQPFQVLALLLESPGEVVTREEFRARIWSSDTFVDFDNGLNKAVAKLRTTLADDPANPRFIETIPRRGYRFLAPVQPLTEETSEQESRADVEPLAVPSGQQEPIRGANGKGLAWTKTIVAGILAVIVATAAITFITIVKSRNQSSPSAPIHSIAVLPFLDVSGSSDQEYFAAGMTDELIKSLGKIESLRVVSPTSVSRFQHSEEPLFQIGRELGVDAVIEGRSARTGDKIQLTVRLVGIAENEELWASTYTGDMRQLLALQEEIAGTVARQIRVELTLQEKDGFKPKHIPVPEAYDAYLEGRYYYYHLGNRWTTVWWKKSCKYFEQAIQLDPQYAAAYAGLADCYTAMNTTGMRVPAQDQIDPAKAPAMAKMAIQLDDTDAGGHAALGTIFLNNWQWPEAYKEFMRAVSLQSNDPEMHLRLVSYYRALGKIREAIEETKAATGLDPTSADFTSRLGFLCLVDGQYEEAERQFRKAIGFEPGILSAKKGLFLLYEHQRRFPEAIAELSNFLRSSRHPDRARQVLEIYRKSGYKQATQYAMREEIKDDFEENAKPFFLAADYARLGDKEKAFQYLQQAYDEHASQLSGLKVSLDFASFSSDARFQTILKNLRLDNESLAAQKNP